MGDDCIIEDSTETSPIAWVKCEAKLMCSVYLIFFKLFNSFLCC